MVKGHLPKDLLLIILRHYSNGFYKGDRLERRGYTNVSCGGDMKKRRSTSEYVFSAQ